MMNEWSGETFDHLPGRRPVLGDVRSLVRGQPIDNLMRMGPNFGPMFELQIFSERLVFVQSAELAAELCDDTRFDKALAPSVEALRQFAGDALFTAYSSEPNWQTAHDILMPAFAKDAMRGYHDTMLDVSDELFEKWDECGDWIDLVPDMTRLTLETITRSAFSRDFGSFESNEPHPFVVAMLAAMTTGLRKGTIRGMPGHRFVDRRIDRRNAIKQAYVDELLDDLIQERKTSGARHGDLLDLMLDTAHPVTGARLSDTNIRYQILTFLVAGHETTSGALSFALYYLTRDAQAMAAAREEVDQIIGCDRDAKPTFEQIPKFRHLRRVLDESLRLWPTAPAFARRPKATTVIGTRHRMTPDDMAIIVLPLVHRDKAAWGEDADEFRPDRFTRHNSAGRAKNVYKPFGTGERACIGRQFALHEATLVLARILHRFEVRGDPDYELSISERLTIVPKDLRIQIAPR